MKPTQPIQDDKNGDDEHEESVIEFKRQDGVEGDEGSDNEIVDEY